MTQQLISRLQENIATAVIGKPEPIRLSIVTLLAGGHLLIEDAPGLGKTALARAISKSVGCEFSRIQFTPDLLPSDILGTNVFRPNTGNFDFVAGPIFTNVLLADEINRTTPRTQSALLEAMSERQVTIDGKALPLKSPFLVIATQNPYEFEGTYPLPENQMDRFMICMEVGYPDFEAEKSILNVHRSGEPVEGLQSVVTEAQIQELQNTVRDVRVDDSISEYILKIAGNTRDNPELLLGVSTRGALTLYRAAQAMATVEGRDFVIPDDVKSLAVPVLAHRVFCKSAMRDNHRQRAAEIIRQILDQVPVPS